MITTETSAESLTGSSEAVITAQGINLERGGKGCSGVLLYVGREGSEQAN